MTKITTIDEGEGYHPIIIKETDGIYIIRQGEDVIVLDAKHMAAVLAALNAKPID